MFHDLVPVPPATSGPLSQLRRRLSYHTLEDCPTPNQKGAEPLALFHVERSALHLGDNRRGTGARGGITPGTNPRLRYWGKGLPRVSGIRKIRMAAAR